MGKYLVISLLFLVLIFFFSNPLFAQERFFDVIKLSDGTLHFGKISRDNGNDSVMTFYSAIGDTLFFKRHDIVRQFTMKYMTKDGKIIPQYKSPGISFFLSFLLTGGGQFYNGDIWKGATQLGLGVIGAWMVVYDFERSLFNDSPDNLKIATAGFAIMLAAKLWSLIDAPISSIRKNHESRKPYQDYFRRIEQGKKSLNISAREDFLDLSVNIRF